MKCPTFLIMLIHYLFAIQSSGKKRFVLDISAFNKFIKYVKVNFEVFKIAEEFVVEDDKV